ncbi:hypothetical protein QJS04_geneDACA012628 [Acorus gramineus]|uniref:Uncharacterized protein n=1 Tax=Acorus gramineus TaxID=55184 RepID=A0AAV9B3A9_ACOGR|nr:hypothetical protein QJS04_geneDACA012628 [Acorus gramineus]
MVISSYSTSSEQLSFEERNAIPRGGSSPRSSRRSPAATPTSSCSSGFKTGPD